MDGGRVGEAKLTQHSFSNPINSPSPFLGPRALEGAATREAEPATVTVDAVIV